MAVFPTERKCVECGKVFLGFDQWAFRRNGEWLCSWRCLRAHDSQEKMMKINGRLNRAGKEKVLEMLGLGIDPQRIADKMGVSIQAVMYYKNRAEA